MSKAENRSLQNHPEIHFLKLPAVYIKTVDQYENDLTKHYHWVPEYDYC